MFMLVILDLLPSVCSAGTYSLLSAHCHLHEAHGTDGLHLDPVSRRNRIRSEGPLYRTASPVVVVRLEVSKREEVIIPPDAGTLYNVYVDIPVISYLMMQPGEILSEKVRAILTGRQARDLYGVNLLVSHGYFTLAK